MKKLTINSTLNHKAHTYEPMQIEVEKVITLYGKRFEQLKAHPLDDVPEIIDLPFIFRKSRSFTKGHSPIIIYNFSRVCLYSKVI